MTPKTNIIHKRNFSIDTMFVLFFLALELGRSLEWMAADTAMIVLTIVMVLVLPYFLPSEAEPPSFSRWLGERVAITAIGLVMGLGLKQTLGSLVPEAFKFVPMTGLIVAAMISCYIQFYGLLRLRLVK